MPKVDYDQIYKLIALDLRVAGIVHEFISDKLIMETDGAFEMGLGILESLRPVKEKIAKLFEEACNTKTE